MRLEIVNIILVLSHTVFLMSGITIGLLVSGILRS